MDTREPDPADDLKFVLTEAGPKDDAFADLLDEIVAKRALKVPRVVDLGNEHG